MSKKKTRWSAKRKMQVVLRLLAGEPLDEVSRDVGVEAYRIAEWRDRANDAMAESLKAQPNTAQTAALEAQKRQLQAKVGEIVMDNELLRQKIARLEANVPFPRRRRSK